MSHLTAAEREVLVLVNRGLSTSQIADRLGIALSTVKSHIGSLYEKTGSRTRVELAQEWDLYLRNEIRRLQRLLDPDDEPEG